MNQTSGTVRVPEDCVTLEEAVARVHGDATLTQIVVGEGGHTVKTYTDQWGRTSNILVIPSAMHIVGTGSGPNAEGLTRIQGGIRFEKGIEHCHLQNITLHHSELSGVLGECAFTLQDVIVEHCHGTGLMGNGTGCNAICINLMVHQCEGDGVAVQEGACITLVGNKTTVHHNCKWYGSGFSVAGKYSTIQLLYPLTKDVSHDNGRDWGVSDTAHLRQIKTVGAPTLHTHRAHRAHQVDYTREYLKIVNKHRRGLGTNT